MKEFAWYALAAVGEIAGCFTFWMWLRQAGSPLWILPGILSLAVFATALTRVDTTTAGRAYAAYGGIYILAALLWLWAVEKTRPDRWDIIGVAICLFGTVVILFGPRGK